jgi:hypothetical protein
VFEGRHARRHERSEAQSFRKALGSRDAADRADDSSAQTYSIYRAYANPLVEVQLALCTLSCYFVDMGASAAATAPRNAAPRDEVALAAHDSVQTTVAALAVIAGWAVGMWIAFNPMISSGLARMQSDWGDTRLNNYILEHTYRWLLGVHGHRALWSPPVFYPAKNTAAYSDILLGVAPIYWLWRAVGAAPDTAFQLWIMTIASVNYVVAVICSRRLLGVGWLPAAFGGFVFAFASTRVAQLVHQQLTGQFYVLVACYALVRIFDEPVDPQARARAEAHRPWWIAVLGAGVVAQLWAGYYMGWFLVFALAIGAAWAVAIPRWRRRLWAVVRQNPQAIGLTLIGVELTLIPLAIPYLRAAGDVGLRTYDNVTRYLPRLWSWVFMGTESHYYSWMYRFPAIHNTPEGREHRLGIGLLTTLIVIVGLWAGRRRSVIQLLSATAITIILLSTIWPGGASLWVTVYHIVPGAAAIRGVSRIALILLIPAGAGAALFAERFRRRFGVLALAAICIVSEQRQRLTSYGKNDGRRRIAVITSAIRPDCTTFLYTPTTGTEDPWWYQTDGMWASLNAGIPTINGYSGNSPPNWPFYLNQIVTPAHRLQLTHDLIGWIHRWELDPAHVCQIITPTHD